MNGAAYTAIQPTPAQQAEVPTILRSHLASVQASVFGSRATGRARPFSDLDLLLTQPPSLSWDQRARLRDSVDAGRQSITVAPREAQQL